MADDDGRKRRRTGNAPMPTAKLDGDFKRRTAYSAVVATGGQIVSLAVRLGTMAILARLLAASDFGLVGMVAAFTGFLTLFRDVGLSAATVQRATMTHQQTSTLFWVNFAFGWALFATCIAGAPLLVGFFNEPQLFWITAALGVGFVFNGAMVQHRALLQREMRFSAIAVTDVIAILISSVVSVIAAYAGLHYWSLVISLVALPAFTAVGCWIATRWIPGAPVRGAGVRSMLLFGGKLTLNSIVVYFAYNTDKILIGRIFGAEALGLYGRAYQLINMPTDNLNHTVGQVAFPALARVQEDPTQLRSYFLKGYGFFLSLVIPVTVWCALCAADIVAVVLGPKWTAAVPIFQLLAPTIAVLAIINPFAWLMMALGLADRSLNLAFAIAPTVIAGYAIGSYWGIEGVATGFSVAMVILVPPFIYWAKRGTLITHRDVAIVLARPFLSALVAVVAVLVLYRVWQAMNPGLVRLVAQSAVLFVTYFVVLLFVLGQKAAIRDALRRETKTVRDA
jgi:PST family polysaccharide transporter